MSALGREPTLANGWFRPKAVGRLVDADDRGTQVTDRAGGVRFRTIYPGWCLGRTPHVHLKLRVVAKAATTQLYFPDEVTNAVYARAPYNRHHERHGSLPGADRQQVPGDVDDGARRGRLRRRRHYRA